MSLAELPGDRIEIRGVTARGAHGVLEHEKTSPQPFVVDVDLGVDLRAAGRSDDLADTVSYAEVAADVVAIVEGPGVDLIEHLAERIAAACLRRELVQWAAVTVHKPEAPVGVSFGDVAVRVVRERVRPAVIALGANLGDPAATLTAAVREIDALPGVSVRAVSPFVDTAPVGGPPDQPRFCNAVLLADTRLPARALLQALHGIEAAHGRTREVHWGPRTLDLDVVQIGDPAEGSDLVESSEHLVVPHPRAHERSFVLAPWHEVDPAAVLRHDGRVVRVADLLAALPDSSAGEANSR